jgi:deoxyribodipyrimidine photo-lyase
MTTQLSIFWFRQDLRISDNPGLLAAVQRGAVLPVYILNESTPQVFQLGGASRWWLHHSLTQLNQDLEGKLNFYVGDPQCLILDLIKTHDISAVFWNRCYEPWQIKQDEELKKQLKKSNIECNSFNGSLLREPWETLKPDGSPYKVFTPFYRKGFLTGLAPRKPCVMPKKINLMTDEKNKMTLSGFNLLSTKKWQHKFAQYWVVGEGEAQKKLTEFLKGGLQDYKEGRDYPSKKHTSRLSPYLHFGEISPHQIWHAVHENTYRSIHEKDREHFLSEIGWREFSYYLLYHFPTLPTDNFQPKFGRFPWTDHSEFLEAWQRGQTGYPIVDAGMRELWQTGYMHNRVRMIVASFLVKNLLQHWHKGRDWFWDCLLDADLANNSASWQWVAGSGADAAPYFRMFNPVTQGEKFDGDGDYTRRFVPELSQLPDEYLFRPWEAPPMLLMAAGIVLGETYPMPIVSLGESRRIALEAYEGIKHKE